MAHPSISKVAFIGTGIMGSAIAGHILDAGYKLTVHNRTKAKAEELIAKGAVWAQSVAQAVEDADAVFTMVGTPEEVEDVYLASGGILASARKGAWLIDLSTTAPELARDIHDAAEVSDLHAFDCPVTGGQQGAIDATLTLIAGIAEKDVPEEVLALLKTFSSKICWFGHAGAGQTAKLCNQVSFASCMLGMCDALALAEQGGLDGRAVLELLSNGTGGSGASAMLGSKVLDADYAPGFTAETLRKDRGLALAHSEEFGLTLPGAETSYALFDLLCSVGGSRMGGQALSLLYASEDEGTAAGLDWSLAQMPPDDECDGEGCCGGHHHDGEGCCGGHHHDEDGCCGHHRS